MEMPKTSVFRRMHRKASRQIPCPSRARGGNNAAEAEAEHGRDDEESGLALGREKTDHGNKAAKPTSALVRAAEAAGMEALGCEANP